MRMQGLGSGIRASGSGPVLEFGFRGCSFGDGDFVVIAWQRGSSHPAISARNSPLLVLRLNRERPSSSVQVGVLHSSCVLL
jgi:hypothetical protein